MFSGLGKTHRFRRRAAGGIKTVCLTASTAIGVIRTAIGKKGRGSANRAVEHGMRSGLHPAAGVWGLPQFRYSAAGFAGKSSRSPVPCRFKPPASSAKRLSTPAFTARFLIPQHPMSASNPCSLASPTRTLPTPASFIPHVWCRSLPATSLPPKTLALPLRPSSASADPSI